MKQVKGRPFLYFLSFLFVGIINNILIVGFALLFIGKGFSNVQIGTLTSIGFIGAIFQPIIGSLCDVTGRKRFVLQLCSILISVMAVVMLLNESYMIYLVCSFIISIVKMPLYGIMDDITLTYVENDNKRYSKIRSGASFGFGLGVFALLPLYYIDNVNIVLYMTIIILIVMIGVLGLIPDIPHVNNKKERKRYYSDLAKIFKNKSILLIFFSNLIIMSVTSLKITYSNILFNELGLTFIVVAFLNFFAALPEMIILPNFSKVFGKYSYKQMMLILMVLTFMQVIVFAFVTNVVLLFIVIGFQGVVFAAYVPTIFGTLKSHLEDDVSSTGILINSMIQSIGTFFISYVIITNVFKYYNLKLVFIALGIISLLLIVPYCFYKEKESVYE